MGRGLSPRWGCRAAGHKTARLRRPNDEPPVTIRPEEAAVRWQHARPLSLTRGSKGHTPFIRLVFATASAASCQRLRTFVLHSMVQTKSDEKHEERAG